MELPSVFDVVGSISYHLLLAAAGGLAGFQLICLNPALQSPAGDLRALVERSFWRWTAIAAVAAVPAVILHIVVLYRDKAKGAPVGEWLFSGRDGLVALTELLLAGCLLVVALRGKGSSRRYVTIAVTCAVIFLADNFPSNLHSELTSLVVSRLSHAGHLIGMQLWLGGILGVVLLSVALLRSAASPRASEGSDVWLEAMKRFTITAMVSVFLILFSGYWFYWAKVGGFDSVNHELLSTPYGRVVALKIVLTLLLCACGGLNEFVVVPRIVRGIATVKTLLGVVGVEIVLMVGVVTCVPFLIGGAREQYYAAIHPEASKAQVKAVSSAPIDAQFWTFFLVLTLLTAAVLVAAGLASIRLGRRLQPIDKSGASTAPHADRKRMSEAPTA